MYPPLIVINKNQVTIKGGQPHTCLPDLLCIIKCLSALESVIGCRLSVIKVLLLHHILLFVFNWGRVYRGLLM